MEEVEEREQDESLVLSIHLAVLPMPALLSFSAYENERRDLDPQNHVPTNSSEVLFKLHLHFLPHFKARENDERPTD